MTPCSQLISHVPSIGQFGDCTRACVAAMLDLPPADVPHFAEGSTIGFNEELYWNKIQGFLAGRRLMWVGVPMKAEPVDVLATMEHNNAGAYYILGCVGPAGPHHMVCCGDRIVSDPAGRYGIEQYKSDPTELTWVHFLVPLLMTERAK